MLLSWLLLLILISPAELLLSRTHHRCVHDQVAVETLPIIKAEVGSHNTIDQHSRRRSASTLSSEPRDKRENQEDGDRLVDPQFAPERITPFFIEPLDASLREKLTSPSGPLMRALRVMSNVLLVRPLRENLTLTPSCRETFSSGDNRGSCMELNTSTMCGMFTVPDQFLGTELQCDTPDDSTSCSEQGPNGEGLATDFLLFVGADSQQSSCGNGVYAFSSSCAKDAYHRPTAGYINLCIQNIHSSILERDDSILYNILLHELVHALGFSRHRLSDFHDGNLNFYTPQVTGTYNGNEITGIRSPKVLEVGRAHFGCKNLPYVPWENFGETSDMSSHWEARVLYHETMVAFISRDYSVLSNFTLAFFEDSGWYRVNYTSLADLDQLDLLWGRGLGCPFVLEPCSQENYPYLCNTSRTYQCTFDLVSGGRCSSMNGFFDGCPVVTPSDTSLSCIHQENAPETNSTVIQMDGHGSICVEIELTTTVSPTLSTIPLCYDYQYFNDVMQNNLQITTFNTTFWCNGTTENRTTYEIQERSGKLKFYCPHGNQLNVRLALAGQTEYQFNGNVIDEVETTPEGSSSPTWPGILIACIAVLAVMLCFGLPLLLISIKAIDCSRKADSDVTDPNVVVAMNLTRTSSNLTEIVMV